jgi:hypothetical protein
MPVETGLMNLALYVLAKFFAYTVWCVFGIELLRSSERAICGPLTTAEASPQEKWLLATGYGLLRLLMGVFFGLLIWLLGSVVAENIVSAPGRDVMTYLVVYIPVRWLEWTILAWFMARNTTKHIGYGWRLGGIAISCFADIPLIAAMGWTLPIGRFFC